MHRIRLVYIIIIVEVRMAVLLPEIALESFDVYWEWLGTMLSKSIPYTHRHRKIF